MIGASIGFSQCYGCFFIIIFSWIILSINAGTGVLGPPKIAIKVKDGLGHALLQPLQLWCQAVDESSRRAVKISSGFFYPLRDKTIKYDARLNKNADNASVAIEHLQTNYAGNWTCLLNLQNGNVVNGTIQVFVRPVIWNTNSSLRVEAKHGNFSLEASGVTIRRGKSTELSCPVTGHPKPNVFWTKGSQNITFNDHYTQNGTSLIINNATDADEDLYTCTARNSFKVEPESKDDKPYTLTLERKVRIKSQLAWLSPLIVILVILILLIVIIALCEFRRKSNERKLILEAPDEE